MNRFISKISALLWDNPLSRKAGARFHSWGETLLNTRFLVWLTGQPNVCPEGDCAAAVADGFRGMITRLLNHGWIHRLLNRSVFLHPALFCFLTLLLLPFVPTMVMLALVACTLLSLMIRQGLGRGQKPLYSPGIRWAGLMAAVYLMAIAASAYPMKSLFPGLLTAMFVSFALWSYGSIRSYSRLRTAFGLIALGAVAVSLYGLWQFIHPAAYNSGWVDEDMFAGIRLRVYSTFANPNVLGEYFLLTIPFAAALALTASNRRKKLLWAAAALLMCMVMLLTYSRGGYIGLILAACIFLVLLDRRFLLLIGVAVILSPLYVPESVWTRLLSIGNLGDTSTNYRVNIWIGVVDMLRQFWFCGVGPGEGTFNQVYPVFALPYVDAPHSHNLYLQLICDTGIVGLLVFLGLMGSLYRSLLSTLRHSRRRETKIFAIAGLSAFSGFLLQGMTDYSFYNYRVLLLFFGLVGLCLLLRHEDALLEQEPGHEIPPAGERKKPLVMHILSDTNIGGAGRYLLTLFAACDNREYEMVLVVPVGSQMAPRARALQVPVIEAPMPGEKALDIQSTLTLRNICMLVQPDIVQTHGSMSGRIAARACGAKIIYTRHSTFPVSRRLKKGVGHWLSCLFHRRYADLSIAVSPATRENLLEMGVKDDKIVTIMNGTAAGVPADDTKKEALRREYHLRDGVFTAGILARLEPYKGQMYLLDAIDMLRKDGKDIQVLICGAGSQEEALKARIRELKLEDSAILTGFVDDTAAVMSLLDVQLNASTGTEATSLSLIEGMSLGIPVIASSYGGNPYLIHEGKEGLLFPPGDARALADCLIRLMEDGSLRETLSRQAAASYWEYYTAQVFEENLRQVYLRLLGKEEAA